MAILAGSVSVTYVDQDENYIQDIAMVCINVGRTFKRGELYTDLRRCQRNFPANSVT